MSALFTPVSIGTLELKNRIIIAPMCQYSADDGQATDWHMFHLGSLALSGAGMLIIEATAVEPEGRITPADLGLWSDAAEAALARVLKALRTYSAMPIAIQLAHAGRKASSQTPWDGGQLIPVAQGGWQTSSASAVPHSEHETPPLALDQAGLTRVKNAFVAAAIRSHKLGLDAIEVHAAHGYLLHQFLSPISNQRSDRYGGSLENRLRFPLEVFEAMRAAIPADTPVGIRISASDWVDGGWNVEQSTVFVKALEERGCAFVHVSSGGISPHQKIPVEPGYQVGFAAQIRQHTKMPVIAVGLITEAEHAESIIAGGQADMVALARGILYDPHWPWHAAAKLGGTVDAPRQYWRSQPRELKALFGATSIGQR
ncbi:NADH:flavin oxidoreductase/NADH oxidase [Undibacterium sp. Xuan67W]|uniref:NADH:flavin oxidoreductase/NADH oxidase n=1 Tax=Undibacterium sp. Xuan67W TaxID=3413057 RepID=UPI003BEFE8EC